jgi:branched-chain amino acid transport system permease protein
MTASTLAAPARHRPSAARLRRPLTWLAIILVWLTAWYFMVGAQQVANALTLGAIYALVALGYTMVYGIIELINFAHGDVFMVGTFVALTTLVNFLGQTGPIRGDAGLLTFVLIVAILVSMVVMAVVNLLIERLAYRPLRNAPRLAPLITAIGVSFILQNFVQIWQGTGDRPYPKVFPTDRFEFLGAQITYLAVFIVLLAIGLMLLLQAFVGRTRLGRAMRSTAQDREAAALMGVDLNQTIAITFLLAGALAGAAGVVQGLYFGFVRFDLGFSAGLKAFTAAVLGGIGNLGGAVLGGFIIGFLEVGATGFDLTRWSQAIVFGVLIIVLVFRPSGILGQQVTERA